jgi:hypothetical protein
VVVLVALVPVVVQVELVVLLLVVTSLTPQVQQGLLDQPAQVETVDLQQ